MISKQTRSEIKGYLEGFIQGMVGEASSTGFNPKELRPIRQLSPKGELKPFHESLLPDGLLRISEFERSFSTKLGTTFEECARLIAKPIHKQSIRGYRVKGLVTAKEIKKIEEITSHIGSNGFQGTYPDYVSDVIGQYGGDAGESRTSIADLFIETESGEMCFFEIKSPKPNKGQCLEATGRLLQMHAIAKKQYKNVKAFYATAYNPYGIDKNTFRHSFILNYMDLQNQILIGKEFWDFVGGPGTYEEVLSIYQEVGREKGPDMLDQLALGY